MQTLSYRLTFHTPAFLGNADQAGQWRTPPFKALLRQWWRVAYAADHRRRLDVAAMRHAEGVLFGHAWLESDRDEQGERVAARRSQIRLRLSSWARGDLTAWTPLGKVRHPNVRQPIPADLYLGYGPISTDRLRGTTLKANAAIQAGRSVELKVAAPEQEAARLGLALSLMRLYGTVGGRSRNG